MSKTLIVANADSPLLVDRVKMTLDSDLDIVWFSESYACPDAACVVYHYKVLPILGALNKLLSALYFLYVYWRVKPDVLHVHWAVFLPLIFKRDWGQLIVSVMGSDVNLPGRFGFRSFFARVALNRAKVITSKSVSMDAAINRLGPYSGKINRFTWGVSEDFFHAKTLRVQALESFGVPEGAFVVFSPRAMKPLYRIPDIVRAFLSFAADKPDAYLLLAGMGRTQAVSSEVECLIGESKVADRVIRLGFMGKQAMINCYAAADIVVSYAEHDGMPQSLYEAMAVGCFPVFTDLDCYYELLRNGENSLLCDSHKADDLLLMLHQYYSEFPADTKHKVIKENREFIRNVASKFSERIRLLKLYKSLSG